MTGPIKRRLKGILGALALAGALVTGLLPAAADRSARRHAIRIGLIGTLFRNMPESMARASQGPFRALLLSQTGLRGDLVTLADAFTLGEQLSCNKLQVGVFHGFEFAWARQKYPRLRPLMIAINHQRYLFAHIMARKDSEVTSLQGLQGKAVAVPYRSREHCLLYLERCCQAWGKDPPAYFSRVTTPTSVEDALEEVRDGTVEAALVDGVALECYKRSKPKCFARLKEVQRSPVFPAAVIAYHAGGLDAATLRRFRTGLVNANKTAFGRQLLTLWKMTGFEPIPADYEQLLIDVAKNFPPGKTVKTAKKS
jgi:ABC-type phosphate/phosphonate transport system substrate-binding protein